MIQVLVVEDSRITRDAIESQIAKSEKYVLYASIENAANAEIACLRGRVDLILMDVCTADEESGLKAAAKIKQYQSQNQDYYYDLHAGAFLYPKGKGMWL